MTAVSNALAEGLFLQMLHSDYIHGGSTGAARHAAFVELKAHGLEACASAVATEYGDHPVESALRMSEARAMVGAR